MLLAHGVSTLSVWWADVNVETGPMVMAVGVVVEDGWNLLVRDTASIAKSIVLGVSFASPRLSLAMSMPSQEVIP